MIKKLLILLLVLSISVPFADAVPLSDKTGLKFMLPVKTDGHSFVVEATGFNDQTWFDRSGNYHSDKLRVVEKYTLLNNYIMDYEATIEDEEVFTRPWTIKMKLYKKLGDDSQLQQFKCVEFVEELLYGEWRAK